MTMFEYAAPGERPRLLVVDCGMLLGKTNSPGVDLTLPDWSYYSDRVADIDAVVLTHGHEDHIGALPYLLRERADIPIFGSRLTLALVAAKLDQHRLKPDLRLVTEGESVTIARVGPGVLRGQPLDSRRAGRRDQGRRPRRPAHRRLQDGPDATGRSADRPAGVLAPRRRGRRPAVGRLHQRRGAGLHPVRARRRQGRRGRDPQVAGPGDRRVLRLARAPGPAGARRGGGLAPPGRARRAVDDPQHADRARTRPAPRAGRTCWSTSRSPRTCRRHGCCSSRPVPRASRCRRCPGWPTASTRPSGSHPTTRSCWRPR